MKKRRILFMAVAIIMVLASSLSVFAANRDIYTKDGTKTFLASEWRSDVETFKDLLNEIGTNPDNLVYEYDGKKYDFAKLDDKLSGAADPEAAFLEALEDEGLIYDDEIVIGELKVESVSAINVNEIEVTFNKAVEDKTAAVFALKRGAANFNVASVKWNEENTKAVVTSALSNLNSSATDTVTYTLTITGLTEEAIVETVDFAPVEETALVITTEEIELKANAPLKFEVRNQYGKSMNVAGTAVTGLAYNVTQGKAQTFVGQTPASEFQFDANFAVANDAQEAKLGDEIRVTLNYKDFTVQEVLVVGEAVEAAAPAEITLGTVEPKEGKTVIFESDTNFELPYDVLDQFGEEYTLTASQVVAGIETADGVTITSSNTTVLPLANISTDAEGKLQISAFTGAGKVTVSAMINKTGKIATTTIEVKENAALKTLTIVPPAEVVAANDGTVKLDYVAEDQYGNVLDWSKAADKALIQAGFTASTTSKAVVASGMALDPITGELVVTLGGTAGEVTLKATDGATKEFGSVTFEVLADAEATTIAGLEDVTTKVSENVSTDLKASNILVKDQYGRDYELQNNEGFAVYYKAASTHVLLDDDSASGVTGADLANGAALKNDDSAYAVITGAATSGTATFVIALVDDATNLAGAVAVPGGTYEVTITNETDIVGYKLKEVPTLYGTGGHDETSDYAKLLTLVGLDANGNEVAVDQGKITAITSSDTAVIDTDLATKKVFAVDKGTATVSVWIGATKVAETTVTAVDEAPKAQSVKFTNATKSVAALGTVDLAAELTVKDQYGVAFASPETLGVWTSSKPAVATVDAAGEVTHVAAGETTISFVLSNGNAVGTVVVTAQ